MAKSNSITSPEYNAWHAIKQRCENPRNPSYKDYGARGISICDRWKESLANFLADMGPRPSSRHSIDRIDNDGNYEPGNCRWATHAEQARNKRSNSLVTINGITKCITDWCEHYKIPSGVVFTRIYKLKWDIERAITEPSKTYRKWDQEKLTMNGETKTILEWSAITNIKASYIDTRIRRGWSVERALTQKCRQTP
jgi:hypothetical protein